MPVPPRLSDAVFVFGEHVFSKSTTEDSFLFGLFIPSDCFRPPQPHRAGRVSPGSANNCSYEARQGTPPCAEPDRRETGFSFSISSLQLLDHVLNRAWCSRYTTSTGYSDRREFHGGPGKLSATSYTPSGLSTGRLCCQSATLQNQTQPPGSPRRSSGCVK